MSSTGSISSSYKYLCRVSYPDNSLNQDIKRLSELWHKVQADRGRDAIYDYLTAVYGLIEWWAVERRAVERAERALRITGLLVSEDPDPFASVIAASIAPDRLDRRKASKYARVLRLAFGRHCRAKELKDFIKNRGGINACIAAGRRR